MYLCKQKQNVLSGIRASDQQIFKFDNMKISIVIISKKKNQKQILPFLYAHHIIITQSTIIILVQLHWVSVCEQSAQLTLLNLTDSKKFPIIH